VDAVEPPPSKAALELVFGHGVCSGLKPGVVSSVAPSGIPPMPAGAEDIDGPEDGVPSGEVEPMPVVGPVWAKAATPPTDQMVAARMAAKVELYLIVSLRRFSARPTGCKTRMGWNWFPHCLGIPEPARHGRAHTLSLHKVVSLWRSGQITKRSSSHFVRTNVISSVAPTRERRARELITDVAGQSRMTMSNSPQTSANFKINVVRFRPRDASAFPGKRTRDVSTHDVYDLLDLSRYELCDHSRHEPDSRKPGFDDFRHRIRVNIAALVFLVALVGLAAADVLKLEETQMSCAVETVPCGPLI
jgi:hypothetical protein